MGRGGGEGRVPSLMTAAVEREVSNSYFFETRAADRAAWYAARANRANAPPQQNHLAQGIALDN